MIQCKLLPAARGIELTFSSIEHRNRMPTCPVFVGLNNSLPPSTTTSPVKSVPTESPTTPPSLRNNSASASNEAAKSKKKRRLTRQAEAGDDPDEIFATVESPPPSKRRKSTRPSQTAPKEDETPAAEEPARPAKKGRATSTRKSRRVSSTLANRRKSAAEPPLTPSPHSRRVTRSGLTLPRPGEIIEPEINENESLVEEEVPGKKTAAKAKGKHRKTNSRIVPDELDEEKSTVQELPNAPIPAKTKTTRSSKNRSIPDSDGPADDEDTEIQIIEEPPEEKAPAKPKGRGRNRKTSTVPVVPDKPANNSDDEVQIIEEIEKEKTHAHPKGGGRNRKTSTINKSVAELEPEPPVARRKTRSSAQLPAELENHEEPVEDVEEIAPVPLKTKRGRKTKAQDEIEPAPQPARRTRHSNVSQPSEEPQEEEEKPEPTAKTPKPIIVPKRKKASARGTRTTSAIVKELPEIDEDESEPVRRKEKRRSIPVFEIPDSAPSPEPEEQEEVEEQEILVPPHRGKKATSGRATRSSVLHKSSANVLSPVQETKKPAPGRGGRVSKRDISDVYDNVVQEPSPPSKRKASNLRSIQRIPTPSEEEDDQEGASDVFEDSKSTFSNYEEAPSRKKSSSARAGRPRISRRSKALASEEREIEDAPSTIYHSADDYQSAPRSPSQSSIMARSKREMVDNARKELEEEIWQERVANGEIMLGGSSEDDEKENAAEEKGKKPTRTVRGKGAKGRGKARGRKGGQSKVNSNVVSAAEDDGEISNGESHALVVKAMISPLQAGPVVADQAASDESSAEELEMVNGHVTPVASPRRKVLNWSPAKIESIPSSATPNGILSAEEEEMTVDQWMKWVINDEVRRLQEECEKLVKNLEREGDRARRLLEHLI